MSITILEAEAVEDLQGQRREGKSYGAIAEDYGKLEEFRQQMLEQKKAVLEKRPFLNGAGAQLLAGHRMCDKINYCG